jgi:anti-sigma-K factor RskA
MTDGDDLPEIVDDADDLDGLLGAYVLDALDDDERARVDAYLATSPAARAEVDRLADAFDIVVDEDVAPEAPSADLWDRIATSLPPRPERTPEESTEDLSPAATIARDAGPSSDELAARRDAKQRRSGTNLTRIILSVAAAVIVLVVGFAVVRQSGSDKSTSLAAQIQKDAETAATAPGSKSITLTGDTGASVRVVVDSNGRGYVLPESLPALEGDATYQLWSVDGATPVSLGLLGSDPGVTLVAAGTDVNSMAITAEPAGGSAAPTSDIIAAGKVA